MKINKIAAISFIMLLFITSAPAEDGTGGQAGAFLRMGVGARAAGMGNAFTALADDGSAIYWNPAGLGFHTQSQLCGMYSQLTFDRKLNFASLVLINGNSGTFSLGWLNFGIDNIDGRDQFGEKLEKFSNNEMAIQAAYSKTFGPILSVGVGFKYLHHTLASHKANGIGFDAGVLVKPAKLLRVGCAVQNYEAQLKWDTDSEHIDMIPMTLRGGVALLPVDNLVVSADMVKTEDTTNLHVGAEYWLNAIIGIRGGMMANDFVAGASINLKPLQLDYAYVSESVLDLGATHRLGVVLLF